MLWAVTVLEHVLMTTPCLLIVLPSLLTTVIEFKSALTPAVLRKVCTFSLHRVKRAGRTRYQRTSRFDCLP